MVKGAPHWCRRGIFGVLAALLTACATPAVPPQAAPPSASTERQFTHVESGRWCVAQEGEHQLLMRPLLQPEAPERATFQWVWGVQRGGRWALQGSGVWSSDQAPAFGHYKFGWSVRRPGCGYVDMDLWPGGRASNRLSLFEPAGLDLQAMAEAAARPLEAETVDIGYQTDLPQGAGAD